MLTNYFLDLDTFVGNVIHSSVDATYISRHISLRVGGPIKSPALTVNRLCGSGFEVVCLGAESILLGKSNVILCSGTENMSASPLVMDGIQSRFGTALGKGLHAEDSLWAALTDSYTRTPMGITAENLAKKYDISRQECDEYGLRSQQLWKKAHDAKVFDSEMCPIPLPNKKGDAEVFSVDEHPRPATTIQNLAKLKPVFKEDGCVTAGTASGICDGAASLVLASEAALSAHHLVPLSRIVSWNRVGCEPEIMGIGPVEAIRGALAVADLSLSQMDLIEVNEAFAAQ